MGHIYTITSPSGKIYVGQSVEIIRRFKNYNKLRCKLQIKLYNSFLKYGVINHVFQIIHECEDIELNKYERYYQDYYMNLGIALLNLKLTKTADKSGKLSEETKRKIGIANKITMNTPEAKKRASDRNKGRVVSESTRKKTSISLRLICYPEKYREIIQMDLHGNLIKEWSSLKEAAQYYNILANSISNCLTSRSKTCNKFKWKYKQ